MIAHHLIAISIFLFGYLIRIHHAALLQTLLFDMCDVILEATKCIGCFEPLKEQVIIRKVWKISCAIGFIIFMIAWHVCRLYWFPVKVIYPAICFALTRQDTKVPFVFLVYLMQVIIMGMNLYWSWVNAKEK
jgi:TLC domain